MPPKKRHCSTPPVTVEDNVVIHYERTYLNIYNVRNPPPISQKQAEAHDRVDAILSFIASSQNIKQLELHPWVAEHILNDTERETQISDDPLIVAKLLHVERTTDRISIRFSLKLTDGKEMSHLKAFTERLYRDYVIQRDAEMMGGDLYVFEAVPPECTGATALGARLQMSYEGSGRNGGHIDPTLLRREETLQKVRSVKDKPLLFTKRSFQTNKTYQNIFGPEAQLVQKRINFFANNKTDYDHWGIPYKIGFLLQGLPGTGKTSLVGATTRHLGRHLILVKFDQIITASRLRNLFFSEEISVVDPASQQVRTVRLPIDKRIYLLEEIDALGDIVLQRTQDLHGRLNYGENGGTVPDELTLGEILDVFDGNLQNQGRVMFITSNHPEKLDAALLRPGRIDLNLRFDRASVAVVQEAYEYFFRLERGSTTSAFANSMDKKFTMAEVHSILMNNYDNAAYALNELQAVTNFCNEDGATEKDRQENNVSNDTVKDDDTFSEESVHLLQRGRTPSPIQINAFDERPNFAFSTPLQPL